MSTAFQAGAPNAFAAALLPFFFRLIDKQEFDAGRAVMSEIRKLTRLTDPAQLPPTEQMNRMYHEKVAFSYFSEDNLDEALAHYQLAHEAALAGGDRRGELKIDGAIAVCRFRLGDTAAAESLTTHLCQLADELGFVDVAETARANLRVMSGADDGFVPYELT
jgi:hypothetical protein